MGFRGFGGYDRAHLDELAGHGVSEGDDSVHLDDLAWGFRVSSFGGDDSAHLDDLARHGGDDSARHLSSSTQA